MSGMRTIYAGHAVSAGDTANVVAAPAIAHPVAKGFYALNIRNIPLCRKGSRTLATSMMQLSVTIANEWLTINYYHKELHLRY